MHNRTEIIIIFTQAETNGKMKKSHDWGILHEFRVTKINSIVLRSKENEKKNKTIIEDRKKANYLG